MYLELKNIIQQCCTKMPQVVINYLQKDINNKNNYLYELFFENFKNLEVIYNDIDIIAYSQAGATLRNAIEQVCVLKVLIDNPALLDDYAKFAKVKFELIKNEEQYMYKAQELFKLRKIKRCSFINYLDFGWIENLDIKEISIDEIIIIAKFSDLVSWRKYLNNFVHNSLSFLAYNKTGREIYIENFIYIAAVLFDHLVCMFHDLTNFNFIFDGINYSIEYIETFEKITQLKLSD